MHCCKLSVAAVAWLCIDAVKQPNVSTSYIAFCAAAMALQVHVSTNQLINTARVLADPSQQHLLQALAPLQIQQQQQLQSNAGGGVQPQILQQQQQKQKQDTAGSGSASGDQTAAGPARAAAATSSAAAEGAGATPAAGALPQGSHQQQQQQQQQDHWQWQQLPPSTFIVVGDEYYAAKEQLFVTEQVVLRVMRFQLEVEQPHKYLLNLCRLLDVQQQLAAAAVAVLNDAIAYTGLVCRTRAAILAAAALQYVLQTNRFQGVCLITTDAQRMGDDGGRVGRGPGVGGGLDQVPGQHRRSSSSSHTPHSHHRRRVDSRIDDFRQSTRTSSSLTQQCCASGEWVTLIGLQQSEVTATLQELKQYLHHLMNL
jgi:hypothetical protein